MKLDAKTSALQNIKFEEVTGVTGYVFQAHYFSIRNNPNLQNLKELEIQK